MMPATFGSKRLTDSEMFLREVESVLTRVQGIAKKEGKKTGFCIGNTTKKISRDYFFTPIRNTLQCVSASIIIDRVALAELLTKTIDGKVDYIFVDTEKKISPDLYSAHDAGNVERAVRGFATKSKVLTYKGNDLTVDALDCFFAQMLSFDERGLGAKKVAIIGAGNIGFKIALKLTERGAHVVLVRRDKEKLDLIVEAINCVKPAGTIAKAVGTTDMREAVKDADVVIGLTPGTKDITAEMISLVKEDAVLIDAGKGSFSPEAIQEAERRWLKIYRASVTASFEGQINMLLKMEELLEKTVGRREWEGIAIVSGSLLGRKGEMVVDNIFDPAEIYGIADGFGDFNRNPSAKEKRNLETLAELIKNKQGVVK